MKIQTPFLSEERVRGLALFANEAYEFHYGRSPFPNWEKVYRTRLATVFLNRKTRQLVIAYKGSMTESDRKQDFAIFTGREVAGVHPNALQMIDPQFKAGEELLKRFQRLLPSYEIILTGHSLGGSIAEALALKNPTIETDVFNAGMGQNAFYRTMSTSVVNTYTNLRKHCVNNDPASLMGSHDFGTLYCYPPMKGIDEHDIRQFTERPTTKLED
jgi:hypothetical protein